MFTESATRRTLRRAVRVIDSFAAPHGVDRYLEQLVPTWSSTEVRGRVTAVDRSAAGSTILTIEPNGNWTGFRAGQYTQLSVEIDGVRHTRCYSMSSSATDTRSFRLGIKAHPEGLVSQYLLAHATEGMVVGLTPAAGEFHLPDTRPERVLLISGGSGITPVMSMLQTLCAERHAGPITFLHYATTPAAMLFRDDVAAIELAHDNVTVVTAFDQEPAAGHLTGFLDESHLDAADPQWRDADVFVCGPAPLMDSVRRHYDEADAAGRFHQEAFTLPMFVGEADAVGGSVRFGVSDVVVESDGSSILEQAEAAGLTPNSGCRMGICHTCTRSLTCGTVRDAVTGELTTGPQSKDSAVEIRVCVSVPVGDVEIDL
ncbi:ferredoxin reductase [Actinospongicola halichondriae]|uniref:ferredoxin reductase n=1 Tax=Actinospongicola halichondriae TaxID=3236844 RepID=UPI003D474646